MRGELVLIFSLKSNLLFNASESDEISKWGKLLAESVDSPDSLAGESREYVPSARIRCLRKQQMLRDLFEKSFHFIRRQYVKNKILHQFYFF